jgi:8-oxo-dGTP pyrophosphatase MutT (NUDIX family)
MSEQKIPRDLIAQISQRLSQHQPRVMPSDMPNASVLVPITRDAVRPEVILTRRTEHMSTHKGQVAFPGGKQDATDASLLHTALRESHEEIGLEPSAVQIVGQLGEVVSLHGIRVTPYVGLVDANVELIANPYELESIFRVPLDFFFDAKPIRRDQITYQDLALTVPAYHYATEGKVYEIWGLSAMILVEFLNLTLDADIELYL